MNHFVYFCCDEDGDRKFEMLALADALSVPTWVKRRLAKDKDKEK